MTKIIPKRTFEEIFTSIFHDKIPFDDFLNLDVEHEYNIVQLKYRKVYSPSSKLKSVHRFLNTSLLEFADLCEDAVFSYRKGITVRNAVERHASNTYFFQTDIKDFFGSIDRASLKKALKKQLRNSPFSDLDNYFDQILNVMVVDNHLPAGFATSPMLSNICLSSFDEALQRFCQRENLVYTRYSDDIIISSEKNVFFELIEEKVQRLLHDNVNENINLNLEKTQRRKKGQQFKLLGFSILPNGIVTIPSRDKNIVESLLYLYLNDTSRFEDAVAKMLKPHKKELVDKTVYEFGIHSLSGKLIGINAIDRKYISKLRKKYGNTMIEMFIRKSVR